jgi:hypothetical protein
LRDRRFGPTDMDYLRMEEFGDLITQGVFQLQRQIETPIIHFKNIVGKIAYVAALFLRLCYLVVAVFGLGIIADAVASSWFGYQIDWGAVLNWATTLGWVQVAIIALALVMIRRIVIRLSLPDTRLNPER